MKLNIKKILTEEKNGIALLFSLGMLSLLLVLALSFASNSILERKVSYNTDNRTVARFLAQSALNRAIGAMSYYMEYCKSTSGASVISFDDIVSHNSDTAEPADNRQTYDYLYLLNTNIDGQVIYDKITASYSNTSANMPNWVYVHEGTATTDKIIGRFAYVAIPDSGRIDPSATATGTETTYPKSRPGVNVNEISLLNLDISNGSSALGNSYTAGNYMTVARAALLYPGASPIRWADMDILFYKLGITGTTANDKDTRKYFSQWLITGNPKDPEAFWIDNNGDGYKAASELYHRFDLTRTDWDTKPVTIAVLTTTPTAYSSAFSDSSGIPWLQNWTDAGGMGGVAACKNQVAANLVDYCDTNTYATTDYGGTGTCPTYVGLEKCPYINEVRVQAITPSVSHTDDGTNYIYSMFLQLAIDVEIVNLYDDATASYPVYFDIEGSYNWTVGPTTYPVTFATGVVGSVTCDNAPYTFHYETTGAADIKAANSGSVTSLMSGALLAGSITDFKITKLYVRLAPNSAGAVIYDFAQIIESANTIDTGGSDIAGGGSLYFDFEVDDPRQNTLEADWTSVSGAAGTTTGTAHTLAAQNSSSVCKPQNKGATDDTSKVQDWEKALAGNPLVDGSSCYVSTAFIRNAPMQSPWELGCIHRGKAWQTLNIHTYYTASGAGATAGITPGTYANGDAQILDTVKMTSDTSTYGKINLNTTQANSTTADYSDILRALFANIAIDTVTSPYNAYNAPGAPTTSNLISQASADLLGSLLLADKGVRYYTNQGPFRRRSELAKVVALYTAVATPSALCAIVGKRQQDEIIGKTINLTKAETVNGFTIVAVAQAIKDAGGYPTAATVAKDLNQNGTMDTSLSLTSTALPYYYDKASTLTLPAPTPSTINETSISVTRGTYKIGADEILASQKIMATVVYDPINRNFKITKFQYLSP